MQKWLAPALDYIPRWMDFQMRMSEQPGCVIAIAHKNRIVLEQAFGHADLANPPQNAQAITSQALNSVSEPEQKGCRCQSRIHARANFTQRPQQAASNPWRRRC